MYIQIHDEYLTDDFLLLTTVVVAKHEVVSGTKGSYQEFASWWRMDGCDVMEVWVVW